MAIKQFNTPILFLIFNRPDTTEKVFQKIREVQPRQLFVSADGPRSNRTNENHACVETRKIINKIDWKCDLHTNFSKNNLGCRIGVSSGIDWFFNQVEEGIILEDDCVPDISFFNFCHTLLEYYRNDERIMHIGGVNLQDGVIRGTGSYYFSKINHIWGWATWRRAWNKYDVNISSYPHLIAQNTLAQLFPDSAIKKYWQKNFNLVHTKQKDTWDIQWLFTMMVNNGLAILPNKNLISNIGYNLSATHTIDSFHELADRPTDSISEIKHPEFVIPNNQADYYTFRKYMNPNKLKKLQQLIMRKYTSGKL